MTSTSGLPAKINPFRPDKIAADGLFAGRQDELQRIRGVLMQARHGNAGSFLIVGERGIGKSSLLAQAKTEAGQGFDFLVVPCKLTERDTYETISRKILTRLQREIVRRTELTEKARAVVQVLARIEAFGVKLRDRTQVQDENDLLEQMVEALTAAYESLGLDGILILLDEADKPPVEAGLGAMLKLTTERLTDEGCDNVVFGLAGLDDVRKKLSASHESALRVFDIYPLAPLEPIECAEVIVAGLELGGRLNRRKIEYTSAVLASLARLSEGYPHYLQLYSYCAFEADSDWRLDEGDIRRGAEGENGAIRQLGEKYFRNLYESRTRSDKHRLVLRAMAYSAEEWVTKAALRKATSLQESDLSNALQALHEKGMITRKAGTTGCYRLHSTSFRIWIIRFTDPLPNEPATWWSEEVTTDPDRSDHVQTALREFLAEWEATSDSLLSVGEIRLRFGGEFDDRELEDAARTLALSGELEMFDTEWKDDSRLAIVIPDYEDDGLVNR